MLLRGERGRNRDLYGPSLGKRAASPCKSILWKSFSATCGSLGKKGRGRDGLLKGGERNAVPFAGKKGEDGKGGGGAFRFSRREKPPLAKRRSGKRNT